MTKPEIDNSETDESTDEFSLTISADYFFNTHTAGRNLTQKGKEATLQILEASRLVLIEKGYNNLTLREVARAAGMRLGNLQYYYPTREDLMKDLLQIIFSTYDQRYDMIAVAQSLDPKCRLQEMIRFLMINIRERSINRLFFELWAVSRHDHFAAELLADLYAKYCQRFETVIAEISPEMPEAIRKKRAVLIAFLVEGIMIHLNINSAYVTDDVDDECMAEAMRLASWP
ncbi:TetR/AcrR family transcriptional regulator [Hyphomicrobium sulfonivorans]|uniref:TetR/AcrR family transcriptional regulator n=1 Tax=Hyphomicrobium sulfonivorans TaxID=121290 RepID=UPI00156EAD5B|nr:TetR/AcrR family transcriptional regulator [Hyphomicrobium sulfonivorans]MBI1650893.1 TetR/AcrR family transcriptional regulator [Hyphomicrobium sulfonivorans]NSL72724.1 hypothetical protein [Hyphomicrobium sulfonivorans]